MHWSAFRQQFAIRNSQRGLIQIQDTFGHHSPGVWSIRDSMQYNLMAQHNHNHPLSPELLQIQLTVFEEALPDPKLDEIHPIVPDDLSALKKVSLIQGWKMCIKSFKVDFVPAQIPISNISYSKCSVEPCFKVLWNIAKMEPIWPWHIPHSTYTE